MIGRTVAQNAADCKAALRRRRRGGAEFPGYREKTGNTLFFGLPGGKRRKKIKYSRMLRENSLRKLTGDFSA